MSLTLILVLNDHLPNSIAKSLTPRHGASVSCICAALRSGPSAAEDVGRLTYWWEVLEMLGPDAPRRSHDQLTHIHWTEKSAVIAKITRV